MPYRILNIRFGSGKVEVLSEIDITYEIDDFCFVQDFGFLFALKNEHCISHVDLTGSLTLSWLGDIGKEGYKDCTGMHAELSYPSSICYSKSSCQCFIIEKGGASIRMVYLQPAYAATILNKHKIESMGKNTSGFPKRDIKTCCCSSGRFMEIYWAIDKANICYRYNRGIVKPFLGNGKRGYSIGSTKSDSMINNPRGVAFVEKGRNLYVSDNGNHCIRRVDKDKVDLFEGNPLENEIVGSPTCLKHYSGMFYFIDGNIVKYFHGGGNSRGNIYCGGSNSVKFIEMDGRDLLILEKINV